MGGKIVRLEKEGFLDGMVFKVLEDFGIFFKFGFVFFFLDGLGFIFLGRFFLSGTVVRFFFVDIFGVFGNFGDSCFIMGFLCFLGLEKVFIVGGYCDGVVEYLGW